MGPVEGTAVPPRFELNDPGVRWRQAGTILHVERRLAIGSLVAPVALLFVFIIGLVGSIIDGAYLITGFMGLAMVIPLGYLFMRLVQRTDVEVDAGGVRWTVHQPRHFKGAWSRRRIDGLRVRIHPKGARDLVRDVSVEMRVDGTWRDIAHGSRKGRAERLAEAIGLVMGLVPDRIDEKRPNRWA